MANNDCPPTLFLRVEFAQQRSPRLTLGVVPGHIECFPSYWQQHSDD
jgi:hypothetical protein